MTTDSSPSSAFPSASRGRWSVAAHSRWLGFLLLLLLAALAHAPAARHGFIWDDDDYVTENRTLTAPGGLYQIWCVPASSPQYYPMVFTTFWLEHVAWNLAPAGYHITNILLHALNAGLVYLLLCRLNVPGAWFGAALFAVHPVTVESVAWITERKNTLSLFFALLSLWAYLRFALPCPSAAGATGLPRSRRVAGAFYALALLLFILGLLSKSVIATLPAAILVLLWWKLPPEVLIGWKAKIRRALPLLPFFVLGSLLGLHTAHLEMTKVGAVGADWDFTPLDRLLIAGHAVCFYALKLLLPINLAFIYPRWHLNVVSAQCLFPLFVLGVLITLFALRRRLGKGPLTAALLFIILLFPALGFVNVFPMRFSFVADHFQYHAAIPFLAACAAGLTLALRRTNLAPWLFSVWIAALTLLTWQLLPAYASAKTLWTDTILRNPTAWIAYDNLALQFFQEKDFPDAVLNYSKSLELRPDRLEPYSNLGNVYLVMGKMDEAIATYQRGLAVPVSDDASRALVHYSLGAAYGNHGDLPRAEENFRQAAALQPGAPRIERALGRVLLGQGKVAEAITHLEFAVRLHPDWSDAAADLAHARALLSTPPPATAP